MSRQRERLDDILHDLTVDPVSAAERRAELAAFLDDLDVRLRRVEAYINNSAPTAKAPL